MVLKHYAADEYNNLVFQFCGILNGIKTVRRKVEKRNAFQFCGILNGIKTEIKRGSYDNGFQFCGILNGIKTRIRVEQLP